MNKKGNNAFTLVELLIVLGILAVLVTATVLLLNPAEFTAQGRDSRRISDLRNIDTSLSLIKNSLSETPVDNTQLDRVYLSLPDTNGNINDDCRLDYPSLPALSGSWEYRCNADSNNLRNVDGSGWIPVSFSSVSTNPLTILPVDPVNNGNNYYAYSWDGSSKATVWAKLESPKYLASYANNAKGDGGNDDLAFETWPIAWAGGNRVDFGNPESEGSHSLAGWGPIEPDTNGGNWGGCVSPCNLRVVYAFEEGTDNSGKDASFVLDFGVASQKELALRVLDGSDVDTFIVEIDGAQVYSYEGLGVEENWVEHVIDVNEYDGLHTIRMVTTDYNTPSIWNYFDPYGHLGVDWAEVRATTP